MLNGKVALITGGAQGIGLAIAQGFADRGARVVIADLENATAAARDLASATGCDALGVEVDVADGEATTRMAEITLEAFGKIDVLVNNAALFTTLTPTPFADIPISEWRRVMDVNVMGVWLCCRAVHPAMVAAGGGRVINIASAAQFKGVPGLLHYVTSKGAVVALTRALAREVGPDGIVVNAVAPGFTLSSGVLANDAQAGPVHDVAMQNRIVDRHQRPSDVVGAVLFLAGPDSEFVAGQTLVVDGGSYLH